jgi:hypothetical protein
MPPPQSPLPAFPGERDKTMSTPIITSITNAIEMQIEAEVQRRVKDIMGNPPPIPAWARDQFREIGLDCTPNGLRELILLAKRPSSNYQEELTKINKLQESNKFLADSIVKNDIVYSEKIESIEAAVIEILENCNEYNSNVDLEKLSLEELIVEVENFISNTTVEMKDTKESIEEAHDILSRLLN